MATAEGRQIIKGAAVGTLGWLAACYFLSPGFKALDIKSKATRRLIIEECLREPRKPKSRDMMRDCPLSALSAAHVAMLRDRKVGMPGAANNRRKYLSAMFGYAVEHKLMRMNPARDVRKVAYATSGFHTWSVDEVSQFETRHPIGTKARLALALLLYLGVRRGDVVTLGRQHVKAGWLRMVPAENAAPPRYGLGEAGSADPRRHQRQVPRRQLDVSGDRTRQALHGERIRRLVPRPLR
ncbi:MAG: hypothetical protein WBF47_09260 [Xanthobacteraceae bacterium]